MAHNLEQCVRLMEQAAGKSAKVRSFSLCYLLTDRVLSAGPEKFPASLRTGRCVCDSPNLARVEVVLGETEEQPRKKTKLSARVKLGYPPAQRIWSSSGGGCCVWAGRGGGLIVG